MWIATCRIKSGTDTQLNLIILLMFINQISALMLGYESVTPEFTLLKFVGQLHGFISYGYGSRTDFSIIY